jgi:hypothetical protein
MELGRQNAAFLATEVLAGLGPIFEILIVIMIVSHHLGTLNMASGFNTTN